jgi:hypothetical protein
VGGEWEGVQVVRGFCLGRRCLLMGCGGVGACADAMSCGRRVMASIQALYYAIYARYINAETKFNNMLKCTPTAIYSIRPKSSATANAASVLLLTSSTSTPGATSVSVSVPRLRST